MQTLATRTYMHTNGERLQLGTRALLLLLCATLELLACRAKKLEPSRHLLHRDWSPMQPYGEGGGFPPTQTSNATQASYTTNLHRSRTDACA